MQISHDFIATKTCPADSGKPRSFILCEKKPE